jgi:hypothetical protein
MQLRAFDEVRLHLVERDAFFMPPRPGDQHVCDVLPERLVFLEVDYRRCLAASFVGDELYSCHCLNLIHRLVLSTK